MQAKDFVRKWANSTLGERQSYQTHFSDVCRLVGHEPPGASETDGKGKIFQFEKYVREQAGERGFADVYYEDHFAIEYKAPNQHKDLDDALIQLQRYQRQLKMPPLLIVTDIEYWRIHTNFQGTVHETYEFTNADIAERQEVRQWLKYIFENPRRFDPELKTKRVTEDASESLKAVVDNMRRVWNVSPSRVARFFTRVVFCLFAEDIELLPAIAQGKGLFTHLVENCERNTDNFKADIGQLFDAMEHGRRIHSRRIPWFNGALFQDVEVEPLSPPAIMRLHDACLLNWEYVEPAIFGTLFERCLDPAKRTQLGAHYTSPDDILLIVEPVLMQPLRREWEAVREQAQPLRAKYNQSLSIRAQESAKTDLLALRDQMLKRVRETTVLDPACGSGNFLYISLQQLMNLELEIVNDALWHDIDRADLEVSPAQLYGIEIDEIAHALASIVVWIGYIQWREHHGYRYDAKPMLQDLSENIVCKDAILASDENGNPTEPDWPPVDVIVGNPPFLGDKLMRGELGDGYVDKLREFYLGRVPGGADLVTYWFEKAREEIETSTAKRVGLLATNSIRIGTNRAVLKRIKDSGDVFMAWSDRDWILEGASVRVSMIGFDNGSERQKVLDGNVVASINSDLTDSVDIVDAKPLLENQNLAFLGVLKTGPFDISAQDAEQMINANSRNSAVVKPRLNGRDIANRRSDSWIIDFVDRSLQLAMTYEEPFRYIERVVKPVREANKVKSLRERWWRHARPRYAMRDATSSLGRYIVTPEVTKYRIYIWIDKDTVPDHTLHAIAREDDYFFGVLHSSIHERWALRMGSTLGPTPRYNSSRTFETFPFPWSPGAEDYAHPAHVAVSAAAKQLHQERDAWLNPEDASAKELKDRTLTNLYNALQVWRGRDLIRVKPDAGSFAPRLDELHRSLDEAVCDAYGWEYDVLDDEEEILRRLLALNLERAERG